MRSGTFSDKAIAISPFLMMSFMMSFSAAETAACRRLVELALEEDLGPVQDPSTERVGDRTSRAVIPADLQARAVFVARAPGVLSGLPAVALVHDTANRRRHQRNDASGSRCR